MRGRHLPAQCLPGLQRLRGTAAVPGQGTCLAEEACSRGSNVQSCEFHLTMLCGCNCPKSTAQPQPLVQQAARLPDVRQQQGHRQPAHRMLGGRKSGLGPCLAAGAEGAAAGLIATGAGGACTGLAGGACTGLAEVGDVAESPAAPGGGGGGGTPACGGTTTASLAPLSIGPAGARRSCTQRRNMSGTHEQLRHGC